MERDVKLEPRAEAHMGQSCTRSTIGTVGKHPLADHTSKTQCSRPTSASPDRTPAPAYEEAHVEAKATTSRPATERNETRTAGNVHVTEKGAQRARRGGKLACETTRSEGDGFVTVRVEIRVTLCVHILCVLECDI